MKQEIAQNEFLSEAFKLPYNEYMAWRFNYVRQNKFAARLLLSDSAGVEFLKALWTTQYYRNKIKQLENGGDKNG